MKMATNGTPSHHLPGACVFVKARCVVFRLRQHLWYGACVRGGCGGRPRTIRGRAGVER
jgi:hypothetical protein